MISREIKLQLLELLSSNEINKKQFLSIVKIGFPAPVHFVITGEQKEKTESQKEMESLYPIYKRLGQSVTGITFVKIKDKELVQKLQNE